MWQSATLPTNFLAVGVGGGFVEELRDYISTVGEYWVCTPPTSEQSTSVLRKCLVVYQLTQRLNLEI